MKKNKNTNHSFSINPVIFLTVSLAIATTACLIHLVISGKISDNIITAIILAVTCFVSTVIYIKQISKEIKLYKLEKTIREMLVLPDQLQVCIDEMNAYIKNRDIKGIKVLHNEKTNVNDIISFVSYRHFKKEVGLEILNNVYIKYTADLSENERIKMAFLAVVKSSKGNCAQPIILGEKQFIQLINKFNLVTEQ